MKINQLWISDMWLTPIGFGSWALGGGDWAMSWGPQDDNASIAAIHKAIDLGINWIDTAPVYGLGHSEEVVGKAVKESHVKPFIFTKCGMVWNQKREIKRTLLEIRREVEESLRRLQGAAWCGTRSARSNAPCWRSAARWKRACAASRWRRSTSTRSTGRWRTRTSKRAGRPWWGCNMRADRKSVV